MGSTSARCPRSRRAIATALAFAALAACGTTSTAVSRRDAPPATSVWRYVLSADAELRRLRVEVCFDGAAPALLVPGVGGGAFPIGAEARAAGHALPVALVDGGALALPPDLRDPCVTYALDVGQLLAAGDRERAFRVGGDVVLSPDVVLWRPREVPDGVHTRIRLELPPGLSASTPWPRAGDADSTYVLDRTAFAWRGQIALGRFETETLDLDPRTRFEVALLDGATMTTPAGRARWLRAAAAGVSRVVDAFPRGHLQVLLVPTPTAGGDPVPFGYVCRGGGAGITLLLSGAARDGDLRDDWVAVHELFHLAMPPIARADAWLSEGVTMYFTELLRVRAGFIDVDAAFAALHAGFARGRADGTGRALAEESRLMHETRAYRRVYWAGAAIALQADLALRERVGRGLDAVMAELRACCADSGRFWTAAEVVARMDRLAGAPVYAEAAARWLDAATFPDLTAAYEALGLDPETGAPDRRPIHAALRHAVAVGGGEAATPDAPAMGRPEASGGPTRP